MVSQRTGLKAMRMPTGYTHLPAACNERRPAFVSGCWLSRYGWRTNRRAIAAQTSGAMTGGRQSSDELVWKPQDVLRAKNSPNRSSSWTPIWAAQRADAFPEHHALAIHAGSRWCACRCRTAVAGMNIQAVRTAPRSPWQNAYVERVIGSIRRECLGPPSLCGKQCFAGPIPCPPWAPKANFTRVVREIRYMP